MIKGFWIIQVIAGQVKLRGPYETHEERENEFDMCLIDPGTEYVIHLDPTPSPAHAWLPSKEYINERKDYIDNIEE